MLTTNSIKLRLLMLIAALLMMGNGVLQASQVNPPEFIYAYYDQYSPQYTIFVTWGSKTEEVPDAFRLYMAQGETTDLTQFTEIQADSIMYGDWRNFCNAMVNVQNLGKYSFYVTAVDGNTESAPSEIVVAEVKNIPIIKFTNYPEEIAKKNIPYSWDAEVESTDPNDEITFSAVYMPENATINETTGLIQWTPTEAGMYEFFIQAQGKEAESIAQIGWYVRVAECDVLGSISGQIKDKKGNLITEEGVADLMLIEKDKKDDYYYYTYVAQSELSNGTYTFNNVDKGKYAIFVNTTNYTNRTMKEDLDKGDIIEVDCGQNATKDITVTKWYYYSYIYFTTQPIMDAKLNTQYSYDADAEIMDSLDTYTIKYKIENAPEGAVIDENTGLVTWTPTLSGQYFFAIKAYDDNDENNMVYQHWMVNVTECENPATVVLTLTTPNNDSLALYKVAAFLVDGNPYLDSRQVTKFYPGTFENETITFNNVDKGTYYLLVEGGLAADNWGLTYISQWYENATSFENATPIVIDCGDVKNLSMTIEVPEPPVMKNISGAVYSQVDSSAIENAFVEILFAEPYNNPYYSGQSFYTQTDANGMYALQVPSDGSYIVRVSVYDLSPDSDKRPYPLYFPMYYNQKYNYSEADILKPLNDISGVNFYMEKTPVWENSIAGVIKDKNDKAIEAAHVVAINVDPEVDVNNEKEWMYYCGFDAITNANGEYKIENLIPGKYVVFAFDEKSYEFYPGYYKEGEDCTWNWEEATKITIANNSIVNSINIKLGNTVRFAGKAKIVGYVGSNKEGKISNKVQGTDGLQGASIYLADDKGNIFKAVNSESTGNFTIDGLVAGKYTVMADKVGYKAMVKEVTVENNAATTTTSFELKGETPNSVNDDQVSNGTVVFPNPAIGEINAMFESVNGNSTITVLNTQAVEMMKFNKVTSAGMNSMKVNVETLPSGIYFLKIQNANGTSVVPFVISK